MATFARFLFRAFCYLVAHEAFKKQPYCVKNCASSGLRKYEDGLFILNEERVLKKVQICDACRSLLGVDMHANTIGKG